MSKPPAWCKISNGFQSISLKIQIHHQRSRLANMYTSKHISFIHRPLIPSFIHPD